MLLLELLVQKNDNRFALRRLNHLVNLLDEFPEPIAAQLLTARLIERVFPAQIICDETQVQTVRKFPGFVERFLRARRFAVCHNSRVAVPLSFQVL